MAADFDADYIIVGAGSAGCVLANRLSANPDRKVLLVEAGGDDRPLHNPRNFFSNVMIHVPIGYSKTMKDPKVNWLYATEADVNKRQFVWPRGKVLGGSSAINGLLYVRGQPQDFDTWRQLGCDGWSWDDVLPYFQRAQHHDFPQAGHWHGKHGPLHISGPTEEHSVSRAVIDACMQAGIPFTDDYNGANQEGVGWFQLTVRNGLRVSSAVAYLHPVMSRPNLRVLTDTMVLRVLFNQNRATGIEFTSGDERRTASARAEVILCAGVVNTPQILELSGVGSGKVLTAAGIPVSIELSGLGENLQDHYVIPMRYRLKHGVTSINELTRGPRFPVELAKFALFRKGLLTLSTAHVAVFLRSRKELSTPDVQIHVLPATTDLDYAQRTGKLRLEDQPGLTFAPCQLRPESTGSIHVRSPDPRQAPAIRPNYLSAARDQETAIAELRLTRSIAEQPALSALIDHEMLPSPSIQNDEDLLAFARAAGTTVYHPVGTCRMGVDKGSVVNPQLQVHKTERLRVVDASVMPRLVSGNTNAATIMIAEKAADLIAKSR